MGYPNLEVETAFSESMLYYLTRGHKVEQNNALVQLTEAILVNDYEGFFNVLNGFLAQIPYEMHLKGEKYYQNIFYLIFKLLGLELSIEVYTHTGRIDAVMEFSDSVLIFEFKLDKPAALAMQQIHDKSYYKPYQLQNKAIHLIAVSFSSEEREVVEWLHEALASD